MAELMKDTKDAIKNPKFHPIPYLCFCMNKKSTINDKKKAVSKLRQRSLVDGLNYIISSSLVLGTIICALKVKNNRVTPMTDRIIPIIWLMCTLTLYMIIDHIKRNNPTMLNMDVFTAASTPKM